MVGFTEDRSRLKSSLLACRPRTFHCVCILDSISVILKRLFDFINGDINANVSCVFRCLHCHHIHLAFLNVESHAADSCSNQFLPHARHSNVKSSADSKSSISFSRFSLDINHSIFFC